MDAVDQENVGSRNRPAPSSQSKEIRRMDSRGWVHLFQTERCHGVLMQLKRERDGQRMSALEYSKLVGTAVSSLGSPDHSLFEVYMHYAAALVRAGRDDSAKEIYEEMQVNHVGRRVADFYLEYARVLSRTGSDAKAKKILQQGIVGGADRKPLEAELEKIDAVQVDEESMEVDITGQFGSVAMTSRKEDTHGKQLSPITEGSTPSDKENSGYAQAESTVHAVKPVAQEQPAPAAPVRDHVDNHENSDSAPGKGALKQMYVNRQPYSKIRVLGQGGSSKVYQVRDADGKTYALKRVVVSHSGFFESFKNEVALLKKLKGMDNIVQMYDAEINDADEKILIIMEYGETDLSRFLIAQTEPMGVDKIRYYWRQMLEAVQVIHDERIVHGDLKPANFLLVNNRVKLIDFGIAKSIATEDTTNIHRTQQVGTVSYMAPEAISLDPKRQAPIRYGRKSDVWSLGVILYQFVFRRTPFANLAPVQRLYAIVDNNMDLNTPIPLDCPPLQDVLRICLIRDVDKRASLEDLMTHEFLCPGTKQAQKSEDEETEVAQLSRSEVSALATAMLSGLLHTTPTPEQRNFVNDLVWKAAQSKDFGLVESTLRNVVQPRQLQAPAKRACLGPQRVPLEGESKGVLASSARQLKKEEEPRPTPNPKAGAKTGGALKDKLSARRNLYAQRKPLQRLEEEEGPSPRVEASPLNPQIRESRFEPASRRSTSPRFEPASRLKQPTESAERPRGRASSASRSVSPRMPQPQPQPEKKPTPRAQAAPAAATAQRALSPSAARAAVQASLDLRRQAAYGDDDDDTFYSSR